MRICIVQPSLNAVSETFIRAHAERLPADVTVVHDLFCPSIGNRPVLSQGWMARGCRKAGRIFSGRGWDWEITRAFVSAFERTKTDAVLAEYGPTGVRVLEACRLARVPLIVHFHGYDASIRDVIRENLEGYRRSWEYAKAVIAVSRAMERRLLELGTPRRKLAYIPYGIDCERFKGAEPARQPPVFLAVGRFVEKKAPHLTILAFSEVHRRYSNARLRMIGEGPLLPMCKQLAIGLGISGAVVFLGAQSANVVEQEMRGARVFVQHSIEASNGDCEGTPLAILEASASGLPVVATRHAGIQDVVAEGETGFLVDELDVQSMAGHLCDLAENPQLAMELGEAARRRVQSHFRIEDSTRRLFNVTQLGEDGQSLRNTALVEESNRCQTREEPVCVRK